MDLGKGCLIAPINTCHSCGSVEFEVWLSSSAGVQTPWACVATVGPQSSSRPWAGESRGLFPRYCHFWERAKQMTVSAQSRKFITTVLVFLYLMSAILPTIDMNM